MARLGRGEWMALVVLLAVGGVLRARRRGSRPSMPVPWTDDEMRTFVAQIGPIGVPLPAVLQVYTSESGLDPHASSGIAWGLAQMIASTLRGLGWTRPAREFGELSVKEQAPWIAKLLASQARYLGSVPQTALDLYAVNFKPSAAKAFEDVFYRRGEPGYEKNRNLDQGGKGFIDRHDLQVFLNHADASPIYQRALEQLRRVQTS